MGEHAHTFFELSHPPTPPALDIYVDLVCKPAGYHMDLLPQPLSLCSIDPPNSTVLCSSIRSSSRVVNEDQVIDGVDVVQPTYTIIHDGFVWESKEEPMVNDESLPSIPHQLYLNIPYDPTTIDFPCADPFSDVSTSDRSHDTLL